MDYNHITKFLDKFKNLLLEGHANHEIIASVITKHISSPIEDKMIRVKGSHIHIQGSPILKGEVLIHKQGILADLSNLLPRSNFTDIR